jgi:hypothetical protein
MLKNLKFNTTAPAVVTASTNWAETGNDMDGQVFMDLTRSRNLPLKLEKSRSSNATSGRLLCRVTNNKVNVDSLNQEHPHYIVAALTVTYDPRYVQQSELEETANVLLTTLLSKEADNDSTNLVRVLQGE